MLFEWDPEKNRSNIEKHGIAFEDAISIFEQYTVEVEDTRQDYGETRMQAIGMMREFVVLVVYTPRLGRRRIISARLANRIERRMYAEAE